MGEAAAASGLIKQIQTVLKPFAVFDRVLMLAWFFEEVAEITWAWNAWFYGFRSARIEPDRLPPPKWLEEIRFENFGYDGERYLVDIYITTKTDVKAGWKLEVEWHEGRAEFPVKREPQTLKKTLSFKHLPLRIRIKVYAPRWKVWIPEEYAIEYIGERGTREMWYDYDPGIVTYPYRKEKVWEEWKIMDWTTVPTEKFIKSVEKYHADRLNEMIERWKDLCDVVESRFKDYVDACIDWVESTEPTWKLTPVLTAAAKFINDNIPKLNRMRDEILTYWGLHLREKKKPILKYRAVEVPYPDKFPEREKFNNYLEEIKNDVVNYFEQAMDYLEDIDKLISEFEKEKERVEKEYKYRFTALYNDLALAEQRNDKARIAEIQARIDALKAEMESELVKIRNRYVEKYRDSLKYFYRYIRYCLEAIKDYYYYRFGSKKKEVIAMVESLLSKLPKE